MDAGPASWTYAYLVLSAALFFVWVVLYALRGVLRHSLLQVSVGTALGGLTEPIFVPDYWNPYTVLDLAHRTGFDLESLLFSFSIGGTVFAAYELLFRVAPVESIAAERHNQRHRHYVLAVLTYG